jgi:hypothetical protein
MTDETAVPATEQSTAEPVPAPVANFVGGPPREKMIPLEWPVDFDGKLWTEIRIRRASGNEVRDYLVALQASDADILPPMIDCPIEVWNALDADDHETIDLAAMEFTPKRLKAIFDAAGTLTAATAPAA